LPWLIHLVVGVKAVVMTMAWSEICGSRPVLSLRTYPQTQILVSPTWSLPTGTTGSCAERT